MDSMAFIGAGMCALSMTVAAWGVTLRLLKRLRFMRWLSHW